MKRHVLFGLRALYQQRIQRRSGSRRHGPFVNHRPAAVVDVVFVEVDGPVIRGRVAPAHFAPAPTPAGHAARGRVDQRPVQCVRSDVDDPVAGNRLAEIPLTDDAVLRSCR